MLSISSASRRFALLAATVPAFVAAPAFAENREAALSRITADINRLASDDLEGRGVETDGNRVAAEHVRDAFKAVGLKGGMPDGSYLQPFKISLGDEVVAGETSLTLAGERLELGKDYQPLHLGGSGDLKAAGVVFAGYGIAAPDLGYDDYAGADVKGKVVVILRKEPQQDDEKSVFDGKETSPHSYIRTKLRVAAEKGAAAVLLVNDAASAEADGDKLPHPGAFGEGGYKVPFAQATRAAVDRLLAAGDEKADSLAAVEAKIDETLRPVTRELSAKADLRFTLKERDVTVPNVVAVLEGEGPTADETVVVGAHFDHLGYGGQGSRKPDSKEVHNGADDNASGTAALLELARRLAAGPKPARRVVFIAFNGEERGLLGSQHYVENAPFPIDETVFMLNFDMVGRLDEHPLTVYGVGSAKGLGGLVAEVRKRHAVEVEPIDGVLGASDHYSFYLKKVPVFHFFTGLSKEYHTPEDDVATLDLGGIGRAVDFSEDVLKTILAAPAMEYVQAPTQSPSRGDMAYFGAVPDYSGGGDGLKLNGVGAGSPADRAGFRAGDVITQFGAVPVADIQGLADALRKYKPRERVKVTVRRGDKEQTLEVELGEPRQSAK